MIPILIGLTPLGIILFTIEIIIGILYMLGVL